ncbi:hypothetical protein BGX31_007819 [Mortierella sp. GBA43]|nr:hypothetical protein BGX31_007819 [Mortierella sp. GBA43]
MGVQMGVQMTKFKEQSKNQMEGGWSKFKEQVIVPLATVARVGGGSGTPPPPSSALSEAVAAEAEAEVVVESEEDLPASYQEPISEKALEDPTAMTITPTMDIIEAHEQEDDVVGPEGDRIKNKTSSEIRESSEDSAAARNLVSSPLPSPSPSPSSPTDQQIHQDGGSKGNNNNVRLSFKATVKKHLKVRPLFTICSNKSDEQEDNGSSTSNNNNSNTNNNNSSASRDPTDTIKDTRNKRRRRHWSFPALLSPSLLRTVSSAA